MRSGGKHYKGGGEENTIKEEGRKTPYRRGGVKQHEGVAEEDNLKERLRKTK